MAPEQARAALFEHSAVLGEARAALLDFVRLWAILFELSVAPEQARAGSSANVEHPIGAERG